MNPYPHLFQPIRLRSTIFKNRIFSAPVMIGQMTSNGAPNEYLIRFFTERARGGAAAIVVGDTPVDSRYAPIKQNHLVVDDPNCLPMMTELSSAIEEQGAVSSIELSHGGNAAAARHISGEYPIGPIDFIRSDGVFVKKMDDELMRYTIESFARGASFAKLAGFRMVTIHAGHGWLLNQFLSPVTNTRQDPYGGTRENRARFPLEVLEAVRRAVGEDFLIELRVSGDEYLDGGLTIEDTVDFLRRASRWIDLVHVSSGIDTNTPSAAIIHPTIYLPHCCNAGLSQAVKRELDLPVAVVGAIMTPEEGEELIAQGKADIVAMARGLIADPALPNKARQGRAEEIRPCIRCLNCLEEMGHSRSFFCAVNPSAGREFRLNAPIPPTQTHTVAIVGGGPAGMTAALSAAQFGKKVTLLEREPVLGGMLERLSPDPVKADLAAYLRYLRRRIEAESRIDLLLNTDATPATVAELKTDAVIIAIGSAPAGLDLPGSDRENVMEVSQVYLRAGQIGREVVVIGGGFSGCDAALFLAESKHSVTVISRDPRRLMQDSRINSAGYYSRVKGQAVRFLKDSEALSIGPGGVSVRTPEGVCLIPADTVVLAAGRRGMSEAADAFRPITDNFAFVGDCVQPGRLKQAIHTGYFAGRNI